MISKAIKYANWTLTNENSPFYHVKPVYVKNCSTKGASGKCWRKLTRGGGGVSQMLTIADEGGRGGKPNADHCWRRGEGGVQEPLILADVIYEQPLILVYFTSLKCFEDIWSYQGIIWDNVQFLPVAARFLASLRFSLWTYKSGIFWASLQIRTN